MKTDLSVPAVAHAKGRLRFGTEFWVFAMVQDRCTIAVLPPSVFVFPFRIRSGPASRPYVHGEPRECPILRIAHRGNRCHARTGRPCH